MTLELGQTMSNLYMREKDVWGEEGIIWREVKGVEKHKNIVLGLWSCDCSSIAKMWTPDAHVSAGNNTSHGSVIVIP